MNIKEFEYNKGTVIRVDERHRLLAFELGVGKIGKVDY
jgi:hypothetical protein